MTLRFSTGVRNALAADLGFQGIFRRCFLDVYTGAQPATADAAATGTLLGTYTQSSGAATLETQASGTITLTGGSSGSIDDVTVGGLSIIPTGGVPYNTSLNQTASDLCDAINSDGIVMASVSGAVVTIKSRPGAGDTHNSEVVTASLTTITASYANMSGGVDSANGLILLPNGTAGVIAKKSSQIWSCNGLAVGTAGWFRLRGSVADAGAALVAAPWLARVDGSIGTSGADLNLSNISFTIGAPNTIDTFSVTFPAQ